MLTIQDDWFDIHIAKENIGLIVKVLVTADGFRFECTTEVMDGVFDQIETEAGHDTGVGHVAYVDLCDLHLSVAVFLEVEAIDAMGFDAKFSSNVIHGFFAEIQQGFFVEEPGKGGVAGNFGSGHICHHIFHTLQTCIADTLAVDVHHLVGKVATNKKLTYCKFVDVVMDKKPGFEIFPAL